MKNAMRLVIPVTACLFICIGITLSSPITATVQAITITNSGHNSGSSFGSSIDLGDPGSDGASGNSTLSVTSPVTTASLNPGPNTNGWNNTDVTVNLTATDNGSGVEEVHYAIDGGAETAVSGDSTSFLLTEEGENIVTYFALDSAGNTETANSLTVRIDKTKPVININSPQAKEYSASENLTLDFATTDNLSGISGIQVTLNGLPVSDEQVIDLSAMTGSYTLTVQAIDNAENSASKEVTFIVNQLPEVDAETNAIIAEGDTFMGPGSFTDPDSDNWTATVDYGDGSGTQLLALNPDMSFNLSHLYNDNGAYTVSVTVTDDNGGAGSDTSVVNITNVAPTVEAGPDPIVFSGAQVTLNAAFTDRGILDTHTALIDWGDGTVEPGILAEANGSGTVAGKHTYLNFIGTRTITVTVTDSDGASGNDTLSVNVEPLPVQIKIGLGSPIRTIEELKLQKRDVYVTIYGSPDFNVNIINFGMVILEGAPPAPRIRYRDDDADGIPDVLISFLVKGMKFNDGHTEPTLTGKTLGGVIFTYPFSSARPVEANPSESFDTIINECILRRASISVGRYGGQCKGWVRECIGDVSGRLLSTGFSLWYWPKRWLPGNQPSNDRWYESDWTIVVYRGTKGLSENWWWMKPGQIIQFNHTALGSVIPHTIIIEEATSLGLWVIDSNWEYDGFVQRHFIDKSWLDKYSLGWTLYQIR